MTAGPSGNDPLGSVFGSSFGLVGLGMGAMNVTNDEAPGLTGDEVYNTIMKDVDPRLTTDALEQMRGGKQPISAQEREEFRSSFEEYDRRFGQLQTAMDEAEQTANRERLHTLEAQDRKKESSKLKRIQRDISNS